MSTTAFSDAQLSIKQLGGLSVAHHDTLIRAMENVFSTELAEVTMSQLIDGLILPDVMYEARAHPGFPGHPIHSHTELCGGAREKFRLLRANFDVEGLEFSEAVRGSPSTCV